MSKYRVEVTTIKTGNLSVATFQNKKDAQMFATYYRTKGKGKEKMYKVHTSVL